MPNRVGLVGLGPCGLNALNQLLNSGVAPDDIVLIDPIVSRTAALPIPKRVRSLTAREAYLWSRKNGALSKHSMAQGMDVNLALSKVTKAPSYSWGASCLPPPKSPAWSDLWESPDFEESLRETMSFLNVQAEVDSLSLEYPLTGESLGSLPRKAQSLEIVSAGVGSDSLSIGNSRLALNAATCIGCGRCFQSCPVHSPWSPATSLASQMIEFGGLTLIKDSVSQISQTNRGVQLDLRSGQSIGLEQVIVAAGSFETVKLVSNPNANHSEISGGLQQSPVVMVPLIFRNSVKPAVNSSGWVYHDLVFAERNLSSPAENVEPLLAQVYLPSPELTGRILSLIPGGIGGFIVRDGEPEASTTPGSWLAERLGIAMVFLPGQSFGPVSRVTKERLGRFLRSLQTEIGRHDVLVARPVKRWLLSGASHHVGAWEGFKDYLSSEVLRSSATDRRIWPADTAVLPFIPAGPHTVTAAAIARLVAQRVADAMDR